MSAREAVLCLEKLANTSSRNTKEELAEQFMKDEFFREVVKWAYDPFVTFGLTPPKVETDGKIEWTLESRLVWSVLHALKTRAITGNEAFQTVLDLMTTLDQASADLLFNVLSKDLRCGITERTINRVLPGTIPTFDVMLAHKFEEKRIKQWPAAIEPKLDGVRVICLVQNGTAAFFSRTGKPFTSVAHLSDPIVQMVKNAEANLEKVPDHQVRNVYEAMLRDTTIALDGEIVSGTFNETVGSVRRKSETATDAFYHIFDAVPLRLMLDHSKREFKGHYKFRRQFLDYLIEYAPFVGILKTPRYLVHNVAEIQEWYQKFRDDGLEGAIVKPMYAPYEKKRSHGWLKMKNEETEDLRVVGAFEGTGKYVGQLGGLIVEREHDGKMVEVRVGGGFSDAQRSIWWHSFNSDKAIADLRPEDCVILHRLIEVEYHEITPDGSLRHPRFLRFRPDKEEIE